jgi:hypothetical protein
LTLSGAVGCERIGAMASRSRAKAAARAHGGRGRAPPRERARASTSAPGGAPDLSRRPLLRTLAAHPHRTAAGFFALLVFVYLWPVLVGGKVLSPIALLYEFPPWTQYRPAGLSGYTNTLLSDLPFADYPWRFFARELLREGTLPLWNPHVFAGIPFFDNPQTGIFSPFSLPLWILPLNYGIGVAAAIKLWVGAFGTYLLVRQLRLGFLPGLLAGTCFAFASINIVWLTHETLPAVAVMLPWMLWSIERVFERGRIGSAVWLALLTAIALTGGHPGMQVHVVAVAALYALVRAATMRGAERSERLRPLALAGGGLVLGAALVAVMLIPEALSSHGTVGVSARQGGNGSIPGSQMPFSASRTFLFPDWWGRPSALSATDQPASSISPTAFVEVNYNERTFYAGVVALVLAAIGTAARDGWRRKAPFAALAFVGIVIPLHAPVIYPLVEHLPVFELVQNQRLHFAYELAAAVLAAFGLQALLERPAGDRRRLGIVAGALALGVIVFATIGPSGSDVGHLLTHFATGKDFQSNDVIALTSVAWFLLLAAGVALAVLAARRWPQRRHAIAIALVLLAAVDMLHFAHGYQPMAPASKVVVPRTPAIAYLQRHERDGRMIGVEYTLPNDWSGTYGLNDVRGYDPPQPTQRLYRLWRRATPNQIPWQSFGVEALDGTIVRVVSVLGARYVVLAPGAKLAGDTTDPALADLHPVYQGADATILENPLAPPRALVAPAVRFASDEAATRTALVAEGFDPRRAVVVERDQPGVRGVTGARGTVAIAHEANASVTLDATLASRGLVVLDDDFTDGWSVRVDGHAAQAVRVNDVMRGVVVGAGRHEVVWSYAVPGLGAGLVVSGLALLALLVIAGVPVARRRCARRDAAETRVSA